MTGEKPIGSVTAYLKTFAGTPSLPSGWIECNGQTISEARSPYNGQAIPNLNGNNNFLRGGATSGSTGGSATHTHTYNFTTTYGARDSLRNAYPEPENKSITSESSLPPYYNVVWIMRIF